MQFINKLYSLIKIRIFICLVLCMNFSFSNTKGGSTSNSKLSPSDINDFNEKTKQEVNELHRKMYVGVTRAQQNLVILHPRKISLSYPLNHLGRLTREEFA